jgi:4'-phosphopantetheinyl transferase
MIGAHDWCDPPQPLGLADDEVHIWRLPLEQSDHMTARLAATLSDDERERAERFRFDRHRRRFIVCRGVLRILLSRYLRRDPSGLTFVYGLRGKPALSGEWAALRFNVAHSDDLALLAFAMDRELGVDVERHKNMEEADRIVASVLGARTHLDFLALPESERPSAFFRAWTRGEAVMKALGDGIAARVDVSVSAGDPVLREVIGRPGEASRWTLTDLDPGPGFSAALAVAGALPRSRWFRYVSDDP